MLAVEVDESRTNLCQTADRRGRSVDVGAGSPIGRDDTREDDFLISVGIDEPPVDTRFGTPVTHHAGLGTTPHQQIDRLDDHCLAGSGFTGERGEALRELEGDRVDDAQVADVQLG